MDTQTAYYRYWDKSKDDSWHCLPYHCLDVGAVGLTLLEKHDPIREQLIKLTGLSRHDFLQWAVTMADMTSRFATRGDKANLPIGF